MLEINAVLRQNTSNPQVGRNVTTVRQIAKRFFDVVATLSLLIAILPVMAVISVLIAIDGGPVFYSHPRIGKNGRAFGCLKFRTMILGADECLEEYLAYHPEASREWRASRKLLFDPRTTPIGRVLRKTSLDEVPQLLNVLKGDMSLVGPRPVVEDELVNYGAAAGAYKSVRPGLTGPWQIGGRSRVSYERRVQLDVEYVHRQSFLGDLRILLRTPAAVLSRKGAC